MLPATNPDDTHSSDETPTAPVVPLGFSGVPASAPLPLLQPVESVTPPTGHGTEPTAPVAEPVAPAEAPRAESAPAPVVPEVPVVQADWVPLADDFLPAAPRSTSPLASLGVGTPRQGFLSRLRRHRDDAPVTAEVAPEHSPDVAAPNAVPSPAPVTPSTPDDRESYAFWSQDRAPRDFSDVMALPDRPLDGSSET